MDKDVIELIDEAILVELNVGELYLLFYNLYPEDAKSQVSSIFQRLIGEDVDHAMRINKYMTENNISDSDHLE